MRMSHRVRLGLGLLTVICLGFSPCGAENTDAPDHGKPLKQDSCKELSGLAPALEEAVQGDQLTGLRQVVNQLSQPPPEGGTPYLNQVLEAVFVALHAFAQDPPEAGNTDGLCNPSASIPLNQTNRLCDLRRLLKTYIHEGEASKSLHAFDPVVAGTLAYVIGRQPAADTPHYEIARDLETMCTSTANCDANDTFDLLQGITSYLTPDHAQATVADIEALINDPLLNAPGGLFSALASSTDGGSNPSGEAGFEGLVNEVICLLLEIDTTTQNGRDHYFDGFTSLLNGSGSTPGLYSLIDQTYPPQDVPLPDGGTMHSDLHAEVAAAVGDLQGMLDPNLPEPILQPLQRVITCASLNGFSSCNKVLRPGFIPMVYHLGFEAHVIGLTEILDALNELVTIDAQSDEPGLVMFILHDIVAALNRDPEALDALTQLCNAVFTTERPCDDGAGHDCPALPLNYFPASSDYSPHLDGCTNGAGANYSVPTALCLSNAEAAIPEVDDLFNQGITDELFCTIDTLVYGCAGGPQPACEPPTQIVSDGGS
jgi:hypothetical protein